jgi:hypothetical protein
VGRTITLKIRPDGTIEGETHDIFGPECEQYLPILQELLRAKVRRQYRTDDYTRTQPIEQSEQVRRTDD